ncbi:NAD(P)-binding protein [Panus rudis PR-1116 ss-1]|nr:NAD(P)-binding protein [Panus rudis PR-1116 ss-1]
MPSYFVTGSSRGIGLGIVTQLLQDPENLVIATARSPATSQGLQDLAAKYPKDRLILLTLDISVPEQIVAVAEETSKLLPNGLDYFISNAATSNQLLTTFEDLDPKLFADEILEHTIPNLNLIHAFQPLIARSKEKKALFITSDLGSLTGAPIRPNLATPYCVGKAALNMLVRKWGAAVKDKGIIPVLVHPGWVATDLGLGIDSWVQQHFPGLKPITTEQSAAGVLKIIQEARLQDSAPYLNYDGAVIPW